LFAAEIRGGTRKMHAPQSRALRVREAPMKNYKFELFADYFQVYLMDTEADDDTSEVWTDEALDLKLGVLPNTLAVGTFRNVDVPVEVEIYDSEPDVDLEEWDHASKGYVTIKSGCCAVFGCTDYLPDAAKIEIKPGAYAAISLAKGLDSITEEWEDADDAYKVILWPSSIKEYKALKSHENT
jgi:hypothetical protein